LFSNVIILIIRVAILTGCITEFTDRRPFQLDFFQLCVQTIDKQESVFKKAANAEDNLNDLCCLDGGYQTTGHTYYGPSLLGRAFGE
jgi:hypothetical protein